MYTILVLKNIIECIFKGIIHPKIKLLLLFTHSHVVTNLYDFLYSLEYKRKTPYNKEIHTMSIQ